MSGIDVHVEVGVNQEDCSVKASGTLIHGITSKEIKTFELSEENLKNGVGKCKGKNPNRVALNSSYSCGFLYKDYHWDDVQTVLTVKSAKILEVTSKPTIIATANWKNSHDVSATYKETLKEEVQQTTTTSWSQTDSIEISQSFKYSFKFFSLGVEGTTSMSYSHSWGQGGSESKTVTIGSQHEVSTTLGPGEAAIAELSASRGIMKVRIVYEATLKGGVAVDYTKGYDGHHYWYFDISQVRAAINNNDPLEFTEDIEIDFYANSKIDLKNPNKSTKKDENKEDKKDDSKDKNKKLNCDGNGCSKCNKCTDWQFSGNQETWDWVRNFNSWKDDDWNRWHNDGIAKNFVKGNGAACKDVPLVDGGAEGSARYHSYVFLIHVCFCEPRLTADGGTQTTNPCTTQ